MSQLLRHIGYGKVDGTSGTTQQALPFLVDSAGAVFITSRKTITVLYNGDIATGAAMAFTPWINTEGYKGIGWFMDVTGANPMSNVGIEYASGLLGTGIATRTETYAIAVAVGDAVYYDSIDVATTANQPNPWHPYFGRSIRIGATSAAGASTVNVVVHGANF